MKLNNSIEMYKLHTIAQLLVVTHRNVLRINELTMIIALHGSDTAQCAKAIKAMMLRNKMDMHKLIKKEIARIKKDGTKAELKRFVKMERKIINSIKHIKTTDGMNLVHEYSKSCTEEYVSCLKNFSELFGMRKDIDGGELIKKWLEYMEKD